MDEDTRNKAQGRLKRVAGQVTGIQRMIADDRSCVDVAGSDDAPSPPKAKSKARAP